MRFGKLLGIDFETANQYRWSPCSVGLYLKDITSGTVLLEEEILINPECDFCETNIKIHGIEEYMVADADTFPTVYNKIMNLVDDDTVLVAHNAKSMEMSVLNQTCNRYGIDFAPVKFLCSYEIAKALLPNMENYKLNTLADYYGIDFEHHKSLEDARTCVEILEQLMKIADIDRFIEEYEPQSCEIKQSNCKTCFSDNTKSLQELNGFLMGITCDDILTLDEMMNLKEWLARHSELKGNFPFDIIDSEINKILDDKIVEEDELDGLLYLIQKVLNPTGDIGENKQHAFNFSGKSVCVTGEFSFGDRKSVEQYFIEKGATIKSVTKSTDYLIVGDKGSDKWSQGTYGGKIKKAMELKEKGSNIEIISEEAAFAKYTSFSIEPEELEIENIEDEVYPDESGYFEKIENIINNVCKEQGIDNKYIKFDLNKDGSYSVWVCNPVGLKKTLRVFNILRKDTKKVQRFDVTVSENQFSNIGAPVDAEVSKQNNIVTLKFPLSGSDLFDYLEKVFNYSLSKFEPAEKFGCCGKYIECSKAKKCLHENQFYSRSCYYRKNLEAGRIFY